MDGTTYTNPLGPASSSQLKALCSVLWDWQNCNACAGAFSCSNINCPAFRAEERLSTFIGFYKHITSSYVPEFAASGQIALRSHEDLFDMIRHLKTNPDEPRSALLQQYFASRICRDNCSSLPTPLDQERALNLAVCVLFMVSCSAKKQASAYLESGTQPLTWQHDLTLNQFLLSAFPVTDHPTLNDPNQATKSILVKDSIRAKRLTKVARLTLEGTDNLKDHLKINHDRGSIEIFRHTRLLKEHLSAGNRATRLDTRGTRYASIPSNSTALCPGCSRCAQRCHTTPTRLGSDRLDSKDPFSVGL
jgi:hypothetical protein